jgi:hypothetical protein
VDGNGLMEIEGDLYINNWFSYFLNIIPILCFEGCKFFRFFTVVRAAFRRVFFVTIVLISYIELM